MNCSAHAPTWRRTAYGLPPILVCCDAYRVRTFEPISSPLGLADDSGEDHLRLVSVLSSAGRLQSPAQSALIGLRQPTTQVMLPDCEKLPPIGSKGSETCFRIGIPSATVQVVEGKNRRTSSSPFHSFLLLSAGDLHFFPSFPPLRSFEFQT